MVRKDGYFSITDACIKHCGANFLIVRPKKKKNNSFVVFLGELGRRGGARGDGGGRLRCQRGGCRCSPGDGIPHCPWDRPLRRPRGVTVGHKCLWGLSVRDLSQPGCWRAKGTALQGGEVPPPGRARRGRGTARGARQGGTQAPQRQPWLDILLPRSTW